MPRVRSVDPTIARLIVRAYALSATFRRVVDRINETDGIVYVEHGRCRGVRACMPLKVTVSGPHRILRIVVDPRKANCDVMASIGHELWHALEVLRETSIRSDAALRFFYMTEGQQVLSIPTMWETAAAQKAGFDVLRELLSDWRSNRNSCAAI